MTKDELVSMLSAHEDNFVERKPQGAATSELRQTMSAFANTVPEGRVAVLFLGIVDTTGAVLGVENPDKLQKRIREICEGDCFPPIRHTSEVLNADGKSVVAVVIPPSVNKPHFTGPAYVRVGSESKKASAEQFEELVLSRVDKCREILSHKNGIFTVLGISYRIGSNKLLKDTAYREMRECRVESCTAHLINLYDIAQMQRLTEPLQNVTISFDQERQRPMLLVSFKV